MMQNRENNETERPGKGDTISPGRKHNTISPGRRLTTDQWWDYPLWSLVCLRSKLPGWPQNNGRGVVPGYHHLVSHPINMTQILTEAVMHHL